MKPRKLIAVDFVPSVSFADEISSKVMRVPNTMVACNAYLASYAQRSGACRVEVEEGCRVGVTTQKLIALLLSASTKRGIHG